MKIPALHFYAECPCGHTTRIEATAMTTSSYDGPESGGEYSRGTCEACGRAFSDEYLDDRYQEAW